MPNKSKCSLFVFFFRPHPHNLVGKEGCRRGVCTIEIPAETMTVSFSNLGIRCVKKKDIEEALRVREEIRVDPYRSKYSNFCANFYLFFPLNFIGCIKFFLSVNILFIFSEVEGVIYVIH